MIFQQLSIALGVISLIGFFASSGKQKRISAFLLGLSLLLGIVSFSALSPYSQPPLGQSEGQQQQGAPAPVEETPSTERVVVAGRKIPLAGDGTYTVPAGKKSLCFTHLGIKDGSTRVPQELSINGEAFSALGTKCFELREDLSGEAMVDFFPNKEYGSPGNVIKVYNYWKSQPGGQSEWPVIRIGE